MKLFDDYSITASEATNKKNSRRKNQNINS